MEFDTCSVILRMIILSDTLGEALSDQNIFWSETTSQVKTFPVWAGRERTDTPISLAVSLVISQILKRSTLSSENYSPINSITRRSHANQEARRSCSNQRRTRRENSPGTPGANNLFIDCCVSWRSGRANGWHTLSCGTIAFAMRKSESCKLCNTICYLELRIYQAESTRIYIVVYNL